MLKKLRSLFKIEKENNLSFPELKTKKKQNTYTLTKWLIPNHSYVKKGQIIAEIETDKITMEFESFHTGKIKFIEKEKAILKSNDTIANITLKDHSTVKISIPDLDIQNQSQNLDPYLSNKNITVITMPKLSDNAQYYKVSKWCVENHQQIKKGAIIAEVETDKATLELESFNEGRIEIIEKQDSLVNVGHIIAKIHII